MRYRKYYGLSTQLIVRNLLWLISQIFAFGILSRVGYTIQLFILKHVMRKSDQSSLSSDKRRRLLKDFLYAIKATIEL